MIQVKRTRGGTQPEGLSRDDVLQAGLGVVADDGLDALSITSVARVLGVSGPAVYHYVESKDDLVDRVCERVARSVSLPAAEGAWDDRIVAIILAMHTTFAAYPGVAARVLPFRRPSRAADQLAAAVRECLIEGGFADDTADDLLATLHFLVGGWLLGQRPNLAPSAMTPHLLERAVRWTLAGAQLS
jgi:TetR/AcrR family transcriptional regulator, tetracycline repressor protein